MGQEIANISNNHKRRNFEIEDLSKPSDKVRLEGIQRARNMINGEVVKRTAAAYVSTHFHLHLPLYTSSNHPIGKHMHPQIQK